MIVCGVSEINFGIQFVYITEDFSNKNIDKYRNELVEKFGREKGGFYTWDYNTSASNEMEDTMSEVIDLKRKKVI